ncbi:MAG: HDOD domain-containing protein [Bryobacteraceae bacterium]|nr:HDOD domain-containing protein [Bryobacteraceae bacterium]
MGPLLDGAGGYAGQLPWSLAKLPAFPPIAHELLRRLALADSSVKEIAALVARDTALSAEVLRAANSAALSRGRPIDNVPHAVTMVGLERLRAMTMTVAIMGTFLRGSVSNAMLSRCWRHSLAAAVIAERLASHCGLPGEAAYAAALLHDIGRLGIMITFPTEYENLVRLAEEQDYPVMECERQLFAVDHCTAGSWMIEHFRLPPLFAEVARRHHDAGECDRLLWLIRFACRAASSLGYVAVRPEHLWTDEELAVRLGRVVQISIDDVKAEVEHATGSCWPLRPRGPS